MAQVTLENVTKMYGKVRAVSGLSIDCRDKEFICILGPSGAGKSSTLRMIGGLEEITEGSISIDGVRVNNLHPSKRDVAMVFETYALYPHMTVFENIAYPLKVQNLAEERKKEKVRNAARILEIEELLDRFPKQLSGGQKQRVAIGRAIVRNPKVFLMDEPIAHLDAKLRAHMRGELKHLHRELNETFIYATHDQIEAISMADRIAVINHGELQQFDAPEVIYKRPANLFVAGFIGDIPMNFMPCVLEAKGRDWRLKHDAFALPLKKKVVDWIRKKGTRLADAHEVVLGIRPEDITLRRAKKGEGGMKVEVYISEPLGSDVIVDILLGRQKLKVLTDAKYEGKPGETMYMEVDQDAMQLFDARSTRALL